MQNETHSIITSLIQQNTQQKNTKLNVRACPARVCRHPATQTIFKGLVRNDRTKPNQDCCTTHVNNKHNIMTSSKITVDKDAWLRFVTCAKSSKQKSTAHAESYKIRVVRRINNRTTSIRVKYTAEASEETMVIFIQHRKNGIKSKKTTIIKTMLRIGSKHDSVAIL